MTAQAATFPQTCWSLVDLFPSHDGPEMQAARAELEDRVARFTERRSLLTSDIAPETFRELVDEQARITALNSRILGFALFWLDEDVTNETASAFLASTEQFLADLENQTLFFSVWWKELDAPSAQRLMESVGDERYWLEKMRHFKPHTLTEAEEKIITLKNTTGASSLRKLYSLITDRYLFQLEVDGAQQEFTAGELLVYTRHPDAALRARAYQAYYRVFQQDAAVLGQIYQTLARDQYNEQVTLRRFSRPIAARNLSNAVPDAVVDTMLEVIQRNASLFQRYFRVKARLLGMERLRRYDLYAPAKQPDRAYDFATAAALVLRSIDTFDSHVGALVRRVFTERHIDSEVRQGKVRGAYCGIVLPELTPWVLLNYTGQLYDVLTLAHELGHAIHALLLAHHSVLTFEPSVVLAETASTFGEILLLDQLLAEEQDTDVRQSLLVQQLDNAYGSISRAFWALFEQDAHALVMDGASLDQLADVYREYLHMQYGDAVDVSPEFRWEWITTPHIFNTPFYVYAYAFGRLLVLALYQQYQQEGKAFVPRYLQILKAGGAGSPGEILAAAGIDIHSPTFWQGGFEVVDRWITQLEQW